MKSGRQAKTIRNVAGENFTRDFAAREIPSGLRPQGNMAAPPPLARSRIPPATQATRSLRSLFLSRALRERLWTVYIGINYRGESKAQIVCEFSAAELGGCNILWLMILMILITLQKQNPLNSFKLHEVSTTIAQFLPFSCPLEKVFMSTSVNLS